MRTRQDTVPRRYSRMGIGGDGSTLNLNFTTMSALDSRFTFTRSTTATYINSSGYVATMAAAATNDPTKARFDYDPTTLAARGLLIEGAATNLLNFSETFATTGGTNNNWADTNLTRTSTNNTSPRNDATALQITASAANGTIISSAAMGTSAARTLSVWLRRVTGTGNIQYTLDNGSTYTTQAITAVWVRYTFAVTTAAQHVGFRIVTSADAIEIWGVQLEAGNGASSYIPTTTAQVTRALDSCIMSGTNFSSWFTATQGTLLTTWSGIGITSGRYATINDGSSSNQIWTGFSESAIYNGSFQATFGAATSTNGKAAIAYALNDAAWCTNGGTVSTDTAVTLPTGFNQITLGANPANGAQINTAIRNIKFFPTRLSNAQLQVITT